MRVYATWQVAHKLARGPRRSPASLKYAKSQVTEAVKLVVWLHDRQLELTDLRQDLLDGWVAGGAMTRRRVRFFVQWVARAGVAGPLEVAWDYRFSARPALSDEERLALLRRARRTAARADPGRADRDPPIPRGRLGPDGRRHLPRLHRHPAAGMSRRDAA